MGFFSEITLVVNFIFVMFFFIEFILRDSSSDLLLFPINTSVTALFAIVSIVWIILTIVSLLIFSIIISENFLFATWLGVFYVTEFFSFIDLKFLKFVIL